MLLYKIFAFKLVTTCISQNFESLQIEGGIFFLRVIALSSSTFVSNQKRYKKFYLFIEIFASWSFFLSVKHIQEESVTKQPAMISLNAIYQLMKS